MYYFSIFIPKMLSTILMWLFTVFMAIGLFLCYRTIKTGQCYVYNMEGPILVLFGLVASVITGVLSGGNGNAAVNVEKFCALYGL